MEYDSKDAVNRLDSFIVTIRNSLSILKTAYDKLTILVSNRILYQIAHFGLNQEFLIVVIYSFLLFNFRIRTVWTCSSFSIVLLHRYQYGKAMISDN
jgi:hypothetical protein